MQSARGGRISGGGGVTAWRCRAVIQQCCLSLSKACKKGSRTTAAALIATLGETSFVLTGSDRQAAGGPNGGPEEARQDGESGEEGSVVQLPAFVKARHLCFDLEGNTDLGPNARAVPSYRLQPISYQYRNETTLFTKDDWV